MLEVRFKGHARKRACRRNQTAPDAGSEDAETTVDDEGDRNADVVLVKDARRTSGAIVAVREEMRTRSEAIAAVHLQAQIAEEVDFVMID